MSEKLKTDLVMAIANIFVLTIFTFLAVTFHKWWIVLFSILFILVKDEEDKQ